MHLRQTSSLYLRPHGCLGLTAAPSCEHGRSHWPEDCTWPGYTFLSQTELGASQFHTRCPNTGQNRQQLNVMTCEKQPDTPDGMSSSVASKGSLQQQFPAFVRTKRDADWFRDTKANRLSRAFQDQRATFKHLDLKSQKSSYIARSSAKGNHVQKKYYFYLGDVEIPLNRRLVASARVESLTVCCCSSQQEPKQDLQPTVRETII